MAKIYRICPESPDSEALDAAADVLRGGGLVIFPTETVYGLAADAFNVDAVRKVFEAKRRSLSEALPVQIGFAEDIGKVAGSLSKAAERLVEKFFPGPITLVVAKSADLPDMVTGGKPTVGVRMPDHPAALAMIRRFGGPIVATSANLSGGANPLTAEDAVNQIGESVDLVLDGGRSDIGTASTVVDVTVDPPRILRQGPVTPEQIALAVKGD